MNNYKILFLLIDKKNIFRLILFFFFNILVLFFEIFSLVLFAPIIESIFSIKNSNFQILLNKFLLDYFEFFFNHFSYKHLISFFFLLSYFLLIIFKIILYMYSNHTSFTLAHDLNLKIYKNILEKKYNFFLNKKSGELIGLIQKTEFLKSNIYYILQAITSVIIILALSIYVFNLENNLDSSILIYSILLIFIFQVFFYYFTKKTLNKISFQQSVYTDLRFTSLIDSFKGIKEVILLNLKKFFYSKFKLYDKKLTNAGILGGVILFIPGQLTFFLFISLVVFLTFLIPENQNVLALNISYIATLGLSAQKILPYAQNLFVSITKIKSSKHSINDLVNLISSNFNKEELLGYKNAKKNIVNKNILFNKNITLKNIFFSYKNLNVLKNINLSIKKNSWVAIYGPSGSGKSTLINILTGLQKIDKGKFFVDDLLFSNKDNKSWQNKIMFLQQETFLFNGSILENIALEKSSESIDFERLKNALKYAEIYNELKLNNLKLNSYLGDSGIKISSGQKQRIGLARAFYLNKEILILDEATSFLNSELEKKILSNIKKFYKNVTVIVVTHNKSLYKYFNNIFILNNGIILKKK
jgi:ATP-binding cassette subfamily B protein